MNAAVLSADLAYWAQSLLRVLGGLVAVLLPAGTIVYLFLFKMMSFMQSRLGPMEAGPQGSMQLFAEVGKWLQKEDIQPDNADKRIFRMAPLHHHFESIGWPGHKIVMRYWVLSIVFAFAGVILALSAL